MGVFSILSLVCGIALIVVAVVREGDPTWFVNPMGVGITVGGTILSALVTFPVVQVLTAIAAYFRIAVGGAPSGREAFEILIDVAKQARREGFVTLAVEGTGRNIEFLKTGVDLLADGVDPEQIAYIMKTKSEILAEEYRRAERVFHQLGTVAPMFGLLGTVIGLILMLNNVENTEEIPRNMAIALVTTFYGIAMAGVIFIPIASKFQSHNVRDKRVREMIVAGILSIQAGDSTRLVQEKLETFLEG